MKLILRVLAGIVFIPILLFIFYKGEGFLDILLVILTGGALLEFFRFSFKNIKIYKINLIYLIAVSLNVFLFLPDAKLMQFFMLALFTSILLNFFLYILDSGEDKKKSPKISGLTSVISFNLLPFVYIILPLLFLKKGYTLSAFNLLENFYHYGFFLIINIWLNDTFAYFVGKISGKHTIAENLSPNKTIEGLAGGISAALIGSIIYYIFFPFLEIYHLLIISGLISLTSVAGDLFESGLKREFDIKDSSRIIPGHGGILDRFDSLFFSSVFYFIYYQYFIFN